MEFVFPRLSGRTLHFRFSLFKKLSFLKRQHRYKQVRAQPPCPFDQYQFALLVTSPLLNTLHWVLSDFILSRYYKKQHSQWVFMAMGGIPVASLEAAP